MRVMPLVFPGFGFLEGFTTKRDEGTRCFLPSTLDHYASAQAFLSGRARDKLTLLGPKEPVHFLENDQGSPQTSLEPFGVQYQVTVVLIILIVVSRT